MAEGTLNPESADPWLWREQWPRSYNRSGADRANRGIQGRALERSNECSQ
jgi:hypothetical protein